MTYVSPSPTQTSPDSPSLCAQAPQPPAWGSTSRKRSPVSGWRPATTVPQTERKCPADSRSGTIGASAFQTRSVTYSIVSQYVETGAGRSAEKIVREGQITFSGRKQPSLAGIEGLVIAFKIVRAPEWSAVSVQLTG